MLLNQYLSAPFTIATNNIITWQLIILNLFFIFDHSWDRWAPEDFILGYTEETVELQERLQQEAMEKL